MPMPINASSHLPLRTAIAPYTTTAATANFSFTAARSNVVFWTDPSSDPIYVNMGGAASTASPKYDAGMISPVFEITGTGVTAIGVLAGGTTGAINIVAN
jgi:hypothetical protein